MEKIQQFFVNQGVWIRPFGQLIYLMPPYITPKEDLIYLIEVIRQALEDDLFFIE